VAGCSEGASLEVISEEVAADSGYCNVVVLVSNSPDADTSSGGAQARCEHTRHPTLLAKVQISEDCAYGELVPTIAAHAVMTEVRRLNVGTGLASLDVEH
jgi:hypothetical protein